MALTQISTAGVKDDAVTAGKIPADAIGSSEIAANAVGSSELADDAVDTNAIANDAVTTAKLALPLDLADNEKIRLGTGNDIEFYHDGTNSIIHNKTGQTWIQGSELYLSSDHVDGQEKYLKAIANGAVELYHNNSKKLETYANGVIVTGTLSADQVGLGDSEKIILGVGDDLQIYHNGSHSYLSSATGNLNIGANNEINLLGGTDFAEYMARFIDNGAVELYHDNSKKLETTTNGAEITGQLDITGGFVSLDDNYSVVMGTGGDAQLYHSGTHQYLLNGTGNIYVMPKAGEYSIGCYPDGAVELYHDNSKRFETGTYGATVQTLGDTYLTILADADDNNSNNWPLIDFRVNNTSGQSEARIAYREDNSVLKFDIAGSEKVGINANGLVFNGDTAAANALDDYEEGSFSPIITGIGGGTNPSFSAQSSMGGYIRAVSYTHLTLPTILLV